MERLNETDDCVRDPDRLCSLCAQKGLNRRLKKFQLNLTEAISMCSEPECLFPLTERTFDAVILKRKPGIHDTGGNGRCRKKRKEDSLDTLHLNTQSCGLQEPKLFKPNVSSKPEKLVPKGSQRDNVWASYGEMKSSAANPCQELPLPPTDVSLVLSESRLVSQSFQSPAVSSATAVSVVPPLSNRPQPALAKRSRPMTPRIPVQTTVLTTATTVSSGDDRLQRAREKFLRDKHGVRGSAVGPVIPLVCSVPGLVAGARDKPRNSAPTSVNNGMKHSSINGLASGGNRLLVSAAQVSIAAPPTRRPPPILRTVRPRQAFANPYQSVIPLLHKAPRGAAINSSSVFSGYVPKSKTIQPLVEATVPNDMPASTTSEDDFQKLTNGDVRRSKVLFALPGLVESESSGFRGEGPLRSDVSTSTNIKSLLSWLPKNVQPKASQSSLTSAVDKTNSNFSVAVDDSNLCKSISCNPAQNVSVKSIFDRFIDGEVPNERKDASLEVVEDWLCGEIYASDMFKNKGLCPESLMEDAKFLLENSDTTLVSSVLSSSRDASTNCDILNEGGFQKLDLFISEAFSQSAFDDMLSYLCT